jgi:hypothetical protein
VTEVDWTSQALEDLQDLPPEVAQAILEVGRVSLHPPSELLEADPDEGRGVSRNGTPLYWRRGLTREERTRLNELEKELATDESPRTGEEADHLRPWSYILLYRERSLREAIRHRNRGLVVLRVLHSRHVGLFVQQMREVFLAQNSDSRK